jgi:hypothetical protein
VRVLAAVAVAAVLIGAPAVAQAAYSPKLSVAFQPATPSTAVGTTSTLTQAQGETANKTIRVHYPPQFGFNPGFAVTGCAADAEKANNCPAESQIGTDTAQTILGTSSGPVYLTTDFRLLLYLRTVNGLIQQKFVGYFRLSPDGGADTILDDLPNFPATSSSVTLEPGSKSMLLTPRACGTYTITGHFTSQKGEEATSTADVQIAGCDAEPHFSRVWLTGRGASARLEWALSDAGQSTVVQLQRVKTSHGIQSRRSLWSRVAGASKGTNSMAVGALRSGNYRFALRVKSARGVATDVGGITFAVGRRRR